MTPTSYAPRPPEATRYIVWRPTRHHKAHITNGYRGRRPGTVKAVCGAFEGLLLGGALRAVRRHEVCKKCLDTVDRCGVMVEGLLPGILR